MDKLPTLQGIDAGSASALALQQKSVDDAKAAAKQGVNSDAAAIKAVKSFEALILHEMMKSMWESVETAGLLGENSNEGQIYRDMFNQAVAESASKGQGIGLQKVLLTELQRKEGASKK